MKSFKIIAAVVSALFIFSPCHEAAAQDSTSQQSTVPALTASNGNSAGSALLSLFTQYKADGKLDMTNPTNIANLITLANNIKGLAAAKNTGSFLSGLISGSKNLVNKSNQTNVLSTLSSLSNLDLSSLSSTAAKSAATAAATSAAKGLLSKVKNSASTAAGQTASTANTASNSALSSATSLLTGLFGTLK